MHPMIFRVLVFPFFAILRSLPQVGVLNRLVTLTLGRVEKTPNMVPQVPDKREPVFSGCGGDADDARQAIMQTALQSRSTYPDARVPHPKGLLKKSMAVWTFLSAETPTH